MKQLKFHLDTVKNNIEILENEIKDYFPLTKEKYKILKEKDFKIFDVIAYRFIKTQGILGEKIFREILEYSEFDLNNKNFLEILSELERMGILKVNEWRFLRELRNTLSHDYPYNEEEIIEALNSLYFELDSLKEIFNKIKEEYEKISKIKQRRD